MIIGIYVLLISEVGQFYRKCLENNGTILDLNRIVLEDLKTVISKNVHSKQFLNNV